LGPINDTTCRIISTFSNGDSDIVAKFQMMVIFDMQ
jgi:hypothetical protein